MVIRELKDGTYVIYPVLICEILIKLIDYSKEILNFQIINRSFVSKRTLNKYN